MRHLWYGLCFVSVWTALAAADCPRLQVSENQRFLITEQGTPFFYLADTAWELFHRLDREQAEIYLQCRAKQGFTVIQAVILAELDGLRTPNALGEVPLKNNDPRQPNEAYFQHVDWIVRRANQLGLYLGMLPTWGDKWNRKWGVGPEIFDAQNAYDYGRWLGTRYQDAGIIWILGGDRPVETPQQREIIQAMARGLREGDGGQHLITFHPMGGQSSSQYFHDEPWLDFNMRQNGHQAEDTGRYENTLADYRRTPIKPVVDGEPLYEDHPLKFRAAEHGYSLAADVRRAFYWDVFRGACGHTYGHHAVWQMYAEGRSPVNGPLMTWREALEQPGAQQMQYGRRLIESRPMLSRIPDDSLVKPETVATSVPGAGSRRFAATRCAAGRYAMIYVPVGRPFWVRLTSLTGEDLVGWWFNPRDGRAERIGVLRREAEARFVPPALGELLDWVLVLDDAREQFPPPGTPLRQP
ncbi:MAG: hypothetical protein KatS3mg114_0226 [Planctomycetaceae bacterium]|nr:MAG: hypothetical protein KatS3mg114_0226 [Planctomycetaceae bacterium]